MVLTVCETAENIVGEGESTGYMQEQDILEYCNNFPWLAYNSDSCEPLLVINLEMKI